MGSWQVLPYSAPLLPINVALLHTGKLLIFAGSGNDPSNVGTTNDNAVWDLRAGTFSHPRGPVDSTGTPLDLFCAGQSFLPDGTLLVTGGTLQYSPLYGLPNAYAFSPSTETWTNIASMNGGRWYPTQVTLASGRVFALSGLGTTGSLNIQPELSPVPPLSGSGWDIFPPTDSPFPMYAHMFLLNNGILFFSGASYGGTNGVAQRILSVPADATQPIIETSVPGPPVDLRSYSAS